MLDYKKFENIFKIQRSIKMAHNAGTNSTRMLFEQEHSQFKYWLHHF